MTTQRAGKFSVAQAKELGSDSSPIINFGCELQRLEKDPGKSPDPILD